MNPNMIYMVVVMTVVVLNEVVLTGQTGHLFVLL